MLDTGADASVLMPADARMLSVPFQRLEGGQKCGGIGGTAFTFFEEALLIFRDEEFVFTYQLPEFGIMAYSTSMTRIPSLLGRDVLNDWCLTIDPTHDILRADVFTASTKIARGTA